MQKNTAAALAAAGLLCASCAYADITIYGLMDTGLSLSRSGGDAAKAAPSKWSFKEKSGQRNGSRIGLKGSESLGNGWKAGFVLEDQFNGTDGKLVGNFWGRESSLYLEGDIGRFTFGMTGQLKSPVGTTALAGTIMYPFGTLMSNFIGGLKYVTSGNYLTVNNAVTYRSPDFNGWSLHAQYSFAMAGDPGVHSNDEDRYMAAAARYRKGAMTALFLVDHILLSRANEARTNSSDPWTFTAALNYDFGALKPYIYAQYFRNGALNAVGSDYKTHNISASGRYNGFGVLAAVQWPAFGGKAKVGGGYTRADGNDATRDDILRYSAHAGYDYSLTRRTDLYADLGWVRQDTKSPGHREYQYGTELSAGIVHRF